MKIRPPFFISLVLATGFFLWYLLALTGLRAARESACENSDLMQAIALEKQQAIDLRNELAAWTKDAFYTERYARERLAMGKQGERIILLD